MRRSDEARSFIQIMAAAAVLAACSGPGGGTDAGHTGLDSGADGGPVIPTLMAAQANLAASTSAPPNLAPAVTGCAATEPHAGAEVAATMDLIAFGQHGDHAPNTQLCFCRGNVVPLAALGTDPSQCGTGCDALTTDAAGRAPVTVRAGGWYAYRVFGHMGPTAGTTFLNSVQVNEVAPMAAGGTLTGNAVTVLTSNLITEAELLTRVETASTIAGRIEDCGGHNITNAIVRAFHANGTEVYTGDPTTSAPTDPHVSYFNGMENPDASATFTSTDGLFAVLNIPPAGGMHETIRVEAWAFTGTGTGQATRIGCEQVEGFPGGVSIVNIGPMRSDYPAGHLCRP